jgi:hypothetical protein
VNFPLVQAYILGSMPVAYNHVGLEQGFGLQRDDIHVIAKMDIDRNLSSRKMR